MKNLNKTQKYLNIKTKNYYSGIALVALMCTASMSQAMEDNNEKSRIRCLWNLEQESPKKTVYRKAALKILKDKVFNENSKDNFKLRISYIKKLGEFLKENPQDMLNRDIMNISEGVEELPISKMYKETLEQITKSSKISAEEKDWQTLKLKTFYSYLPTKLTAENIEVLKDDINGVYTNLLSTNININKLNIFMSYHNSENFPDETQLLESITDPFLKGKIMFKIAISKENINERINALKSIEDKFSLAKYNIAEIYNNTDRIDQAYPLYAKIVKDEDHSIAYPLAVYRFAKFHEKGFKKGFINLSADASRFFQLLTKAATLGHPYAQYEYVKYLMEAQKEVDGINPLKKSAESGYSKAQLLLAQKYEKGVAPILPKDLSLAKAWYKAAAHQEEQEAFYPAGVAYENDKDFKNAILFYSKSEDSRAYVSLGKLYLKQILDAKTEEEHNRPASKVKSIILNLTEIEDSKVGYVPLLLNAAIQNEKELPNMAHHQYEELANMGAFDNPSETQELENNKKGLCSSSNQSLAKKWFNKAAERGNPDGYYYLGVLGLNSHNLEVAYENFEYAANLSHPQAILQLGLMYQFGIGTPKQDFKSAVDCYKRVPLSAAFYHLGCLYKQGLGTEQNEETSLILWTKAANSGHKEAAYKAGKAYLNKWLSKQDEKMVDNAYSYLKISADLNHPDALYLLGVMQGKNIVSSQAPKNPPQFYYDKAASAGHASAHFKLGKFYETQKNKTEALKHYQLAADQEHAEAKEALAKLYFEKRELQKVSEYITPLIKLNKENPLYLKSLINTVKQCGDKDYIAQLEEKAYAGNSTAQQCVGKVSEIGKGCFQDMAKAFTFYKQAAKNGNRSAIRKLSDLRETCLYGVLDKTSPQSMDQLFDQDPVILASPLTFVEKNDLQSINSEDYHLLSQEEEESQRLTLNVNPTLRIVTNSEKEKELQIIKSDKLMCSESMPNEETADSTHRSYWHSSLPSIEQKIQEKMSQSSNGYGWWEVWKGVELYFWSPRK